MKRISVIREELSDYSNKEVDKAIEKLKKQNFLNIDGNMAFIQKEGIAYFNKNYKHE